MNLRRVQVSFGEFVVIDHIAEDAAARIYEQQMREAYTTMNVASSPVSEDEAREMMPQ